MHQLLWLALVWIAGAAVILGGLMTVGSVLLWLVPYQNSKGKKTGEPLANHTSPWQGRLKLLLFSVAIALAGLTLIITVPFPE